MYNNQINQSINHKITYVGPPPKPVYFCMNQFRKFHHSELQNLILAYFKTYLNRGDVEIVCQKEIW